MASLELLKKDIVDCWGLTKYFIICPIHQTIGCSYSRTNLGARSLGIAGGKNSGLGDNVSIIGKTKTCASGLPKMKKKKLKLV